MRVGLVIAVMVALLGVASAHAQGTLNKLVSPGALARSHEKLEGKCESCHIPFDKAAQSRLCRDCHKPIAGDLATQRGFHGLNPKVAAALCKTCHTDHKGREARIAPFDTAAFDHHFTNYPLNGAHRAVACVSCHAADGKYRGTPATCISCHRNVDRHKGTLGETCIDCHGEIKWTDVHFDHGKTQFPLTGAHGNTACASCHRDDQLKGTPTACVSCHAKDDVHKGAQGPKCEACHATADWKTVRFAHAKTLFPLTGAHSAIKCESCHLQPAAQVKLPKDCDSCHRKDDVHKGSNGSNCVECHATSNWKKVNFDHNIQTSFPLRGAHATASCSACHVAPARTVKLDTGCASCHSKDDAHKGQEGSECAQCHSERTWRADIRLDHDLTKFPLIGRHKAIACTACHMSARFQDASVKCIDCHRAADTHEGHLGPDCGLCHNAVGWKNWAFDHNKQTHYPLTGAHENLECKACHSQRSALPARVSTRCVDCHSRDDVHHGGFGLNCAECHTTASFTDVRSVH